MEKDAAAAALSALRTELTAQAKSEKQALEVNCYLWAATICFFSVIEVSWPCAPISTHLQPVSEVIFSPYTALLIISP